jgi:hypothetical protein
LFSQNKGKLSINDKYPPFLQLYFLIFYLLSTRNIFKKETCSKIIIFQSIKSYMRKTDTSFNRQFVKSLANISFQGIQDNARQLLPAFLDASATNTVIVCSPAAVQDITDGFRQWGIELTTWHSLEDSFLTQD